MYSNYPFPGTQTLCQGFREIFLPFYSLNINVSLYTVSTTFHYFYISLKCKTFRLTCLQLSILQFSNSFISFLFKFIALSLLFSCYLFLGTNYEQIENVACKYHSNLHNHTYFYEKILALSSLKSFSKRNKNPEHILCFKIIMVISTDCRRKNLG